MRIWWKWNKEWNIEKNRIKTPIKSWSRLFIKNSCFKNFSNLMSKNKCQFLNKEKKNLQKSETFINLLIWRRLNNIKKKLFKSWKKNRISDKGKKKLINPT